jgi:ribonuclease HI
VSKRLVVYTDGAARGNPGPAGAGVCIQDPDGNVVAEVERFLGNATNNVAEYSALLCGLERAEELGADEVEVRSDSELVVRQMRGEYRVRHPGLRQLVSRAHELARAFASVEYVHVRRELNREADRLANRAIDAASGR